MHNDFMYKHVDTLAFLNILPTLIGEKNEQNGKANCSTMGQ